MYYLNIYRAARTLLLFVIRDFVGNTPLENLQKNIEDDMHKIWNELSKVFIFQQ